MTAPRHDLLHIHAAVAPLPMVGFACQLVLEKGG